MNRSKESRLYWEAADLIRKLEDQELWAWRLGSHDYAKRFKLIIDKAEKRLDRRRVPYIKWLNLKF